LYLKNKTWRPASVEGGKKTKKTSRRQASLEFPLSLYDARSSSACTVYRTKRKEKKECKERMSECRTLQTGSSRLGASSKEEERGNGGEKRKKKKKTGRRPYAVRDGLYKRGWQDERRVRERKGKGRKRREQHGLCSIWF